MTPSIGRIVLYTLTEGDAAQVNKRRADFMTSDSADAATGFMAHYGSPARSGLVLPALIVRVWDDDTVNLRVMLDGTDILWATNRAQGADRGEWFEPARVGATAH